MFEPVLPWESADPVTQALYGLRMRGAFYSWTEAWGDGSVGMPQIRETLSFHIVVRGTAHLEVDGHAPEQLDEGHLALVPRGIGHRISTRPGAPLLGRADELPQTMLGDTFSILRIGAAGIVGTGGVDGPAAPRDGEPLAPLALLCGIVAFDAALVQDVLAVLPPIVRVDSQRHPMMSALVPLLAHELRVPRPGGDAVATRLADVLVVETVRAWLSDSPDEASGWLAALRDPQLGAALAAIHRDPGRAWSLVDLARLSTMSRTSFAERFREVVGVPPMTYLTSARMRAARLRLARGDGVAAVAQAFGYGSEAAFSRAFSRVTGQTPGRVRRAAA